MGTLLARISERIERFSLNRMYVDLVSALAASLCVSGLVWIISTSSGDEMPVLLNIKTTLAAMAAYLTAALLLQSSWTRLLRRILPTWIMVAVFGTLLFSLIEFVPARIHLWKEPRMAKVMPHGTAQFILSELEGKRLVYLFFCFVSLPSTAMVYYAGNIIKAARHWHNGAEPPPSILGN